MALKVILIVNKLKIIWNVVVKLIMEHISQLTAEIRDKAAYPDILVISRTFLPKEAVIGEYIYDRCLQDPERVIRPLAKKFCGILES